MNAKQPHSLEERLAALAAFLPRFEQPDFQFDCWEPSSFEEPGVISMSGYSLSNEASAFVDMAYEMGWVLFGFDWPTWKGTNEAAELRDHADTLSKATPNQLAQLLTVLIRQERFSEGSLAAAYASGLVTRIVRRAAQLKAELGVIDY